MKTTKYLSLAALALMGTLASCQSDDELTIARPDNAVGINVTVGSLQGITRSNPAATDPDEAKNFNQGDQVCVSTDGQDPVLFQCQDADQQTWAEAVSGKFLLWTASEMTFKAYYPATTGTSMTAFTLPADQSTEANIALADYMTRQQTCTNVSGNNINLELERKTARVIVRIAGFNDQYRDDQKTVDNVRIYSQYSDIEEGNPTGSSTEIQPYAQGSNDGWGWSQNSTFTALVVPGSGDDGADFITLRDGENNTLRVKGIPELEVGYSYTYNLTVGKNKILVQSVSVTDWTTGETLAGGQAQEQGGASTPTLSLTSPAVGQVIGSDGKNYAYGSLPTGVTAVAKICYVSGSNGLALALTDEGEMMDWSTAQTTCAAHTPAFTGGTWKLASQDEWDNMISTAGSQTDLRDGFSSVGGTNMQQNCYWSSKEKDTDNAWLYYFGNGQGYWNDDEKGYGYYVRACLAFTVEQGATTYTQLSAATAEDIGKVVCAAGHLHDAKTAVPTGCTAVGILGKVTETGHGLILALQDATVQEWNTINDWTSETNYAGTTLKLLPDDAARGTNLPSYTSLGETAVSNWAVAQKSDYSAIFINLGSTTGNSDFKIYDANVNAYITTGVGGTAMSGYYWSATVYNSNNAHRIYNGSWDIWWRYESENVRPVLGF